MSCPEHKQVQGCIENGGWDSGSLSSALVISTAIRAEMKSLGGRPEAFDLEFGYPHRGGLKLPVAGPRRCPGILMGSGNATGSTSMSRMFFRLDRLYRERWCRTERLRVCWSGDLSLRRSAPGPRALDLPPRCIVSVRTLLARHGDEHIRQTASAMGQYLTGQIREWKRKDVYSAGQVAFPPFAFIREWGQNGTVVKSPAWTPAS